MSRIGRPKERQCLPGQSIVAPSPNPHKIRFFYSQRTQHIRPIDTCVAQHPHMWIRNQPSAIIIFSAFLTKSILMSQAARIHAWLSRVCITCQVKIILYDGNCQIYLLLTLSQSMSPSRHSAFTTIENMAHLLPKALDGENCKFVAPRMAPGVKSVVSKTKRLYVRKQMASDRGWTHMVRRRVPGGGGG